MMTDQAHVKRAFRSDNNAGLCPEALAALQDANDASHHVGYGDDPYTQRAIEAFRGIFGQDASIWFVATGTAANTLAIASLTEPWQQIIAHVHSHANVDESTAPERITHCRMVPVRTESSKLTPEMIERAAIGSRADVHHPQPGVVTLSNPTEFGTVYTPGEIAAICEAAHAMGFRVHVDGARFANAVASLGCDPRELIAPTGAAHSATAGVDALSFGGTKNGLAFGEAVLFSPQGDGSAYERAVRTFELHRKGTGHLLSKHRFVSAPFAATLADGAWLRHGQHANTMAQRLAAGFTACGIEPAFATQANAVFVRLPMEVDQHLKAAGHGYYPFEAPRSDGTVLVRLMCSFDTQAREVDALLADLERVMQR